MNLLLSSPFEKISEAIARLRERKGKEKDALAWIERGIRFGKGFVANLYFERILVYQHMVIEGDKRVLPKMEAATLVAQKYVEANKLGEWRSRTYRFLGRLYDYKGQFAKAVVVYKKALLLAKFDPEYIEKGVPRWLELEGFLANSLVMVGRTKEGMASARKTFAKYDLNKEAMALKRRDYYTWAVWKSGIPIRIINALLVKRIVFDREKMRLWLEEAEKLVNPPKSIKVWGDFRIRRDEITSLKRRLLTVN